MYDILVRKICKEKSKAKRSKMLLNMIASVYSRRCGSYMIVCKLKQFSHISNCHNMYTFMQSCDVFHTQHAIFFTILDTCANTM